MALFRSTVVGLRWEMRIRGSSSRALGAATLCLVASAQPLLPQPGAAASPSMFRGGPSHTGVYVGSGATFLAGLRWRMQTGGVIRGSPAVAGGTVYVPSGDGGLYAVDVRSGVSLWRYDAGSPLTSSPAVGLGVVMATGRDGRVHGVDARTGTRRWSLTTGAAVPWPWGHEEWDYFVSSPTIVGRMAIIGGADGHVYAVDVSSGRVRWRAAVGARIVSSPAVAGDLVIVAGADGVVRALSLGGGVPRWTHATDGAANSSATFGYDRKTIQSSPAVVDGIVYIGSRDGNEYALDLATGVRRWSYSHETSWVVTSPAVAGGRVYSGSSDGHFVHALDASSGSERWRVATRDNILASPSIVGSIVIAGDLSGMVRALDAGTGSERWQFPIDAAVMSSPVVTEDLVLVGGDDGALYALQLGDSMPPAHRAVYWDRASTPFSASPGDTLVRDYLAARGYEILGDSALVGFLEARAADRAPSVLVFAQEHVPAGAGPRSPSDTALLSRYLAGGGSVVWLGWPPLIRVYDPATKQMVGSSFARPRQLTGLLFLESSLTSKHAATPTAAGAARGLTTWRLGSWAVDPKHVTEVLALDETGRTPAWTKSFGGPPGTGWIQLFALGATPGMLPEIRAVAEASLGRAAMRWEGGATAP